MKKSMVVSLCLTAAICVSAFQNAWSQSYPAKPIHVLSSFGAGSIADGAMRMIAQKMADSMGQPVLVEAQSGAGGVLAAQRLIHSAPDGYTILHTAPSTLVATPFLLKNPPYHPLKDFTYITHLFDATQCLLVTASLPVNTVKELIDYVRANPGKLTYGSNGVGAGFHLEMELFKQKYGLEITHVPFRGGEDALNAAAGQISIAGTGLAPALARAHAGKVKVLAVLSMKRLPAFPDVPSMGEQSPDYEKIPSGDEIVGPAGMPEAIVRRLNAEIVKALNVPEVLDRVRLIGFLPIGNTPEEHAAQMRRAMEIMAKGIKAARVETE